ncbi:MAG: prepilin-type N-terminal cleavage/methylation domain-containing protein [Verrucomicrobiota bacterium]
MKINLPGSSPPASDTAHACAATLPGFRKPSVSRLGFGRIVSARRSAGFTLTEVVVAVAVIALTFAGVVYGYIRTTDRAEWSAYSLAAQSLAMQGVEQARAAKWDPQAWPVVDDLGVTNFIQVEPLDVPVVGQPILATNYVSVTTVSLDPPLRQLRADCVWALKSRPIGSAGPFTNTAVTLRAADQ